MPRLDSKYEAEGAEFLVLGTLLTEGIVAYKTYSQMPGYDLVAVDPDRNSSVRIQVKSRWATDNNGFLLRRSDCDFVVFVSLNRGFRYRKTLLPSEGRKPPSMYILPIRVVESARNEKSVLGQILVWKKVPNLETFRDNWDLIRQKLIALGTPNYAAAQQ